MKIAASSIKVRGWRGLSPAGPFRAMRARLIGAVLMSTLPVAGDCLAPPNLCSRLEPNMVAFVGRPLSMVQLDQWRIRTTFQIEERLWGVLPASTVSVEGLSLPTRAERNKAWFVLASRRADGVDGLLVSPSECPHGLQLPADDGWVQEFRDNVAQMKPVSMRLDVYSSSLRLPSLKLKLNGAHSSWSGVSGRSGGSLKLRPGEYSVEIEDPHFALKEGHRRVSILPGSCVKWRIAVDPISSISGRIVNSRNLPARDLRYRLEGEAEPIGSADYLDSLIEPMRRRWPGILGAPSSSSVSYDFVPDADGRFRVHVLPGKYRLTVESQDSHNYVTPPPIPKTHYPGVIDPRLTTEIVVRLDEQVKNVELKMPDHGPTRRLEVILVNEDGSPASNWVVAHTGRYPGELYRTAGWTQRLTDAHGRAIFDIWQSLDYDLHITSGSGDNPHVRAGSEPLMRRFVVHPWRPARER